MVKRQKAVVGRSMTPNTNLLDCGIATMAVVVVDRIRPCVFCTVSEVG